MTKAMTGLVIADAVSRGEIRMDAPVATYLPQLDGSPAGAATIHELVTHTVRIRRVRRRHPASRRLDGAAGPELPDRRQHADDRGDQGPDAGRVVAGTPTPPWVRPSPVKPSPRQPT